jgi:hypothetical protein
MAEQEPESDAGAKLDGHGERNRRNEVLIRFV